MWSTSKSGYRVQCGLHNLAVHIDVYSFSVYGFPSRGVEAVSFFYCVPFVL